MSDKVQKTQNVNNGITWLLFVLFFLLSGALLIFSPANALRITSLAIGVGLCLLGLKSVISYFTTPVLYSLRTMNFGIGLLSIFAGVLFLFQPPEFTGLIKYAWSVSILIGAFFKLQVSTTLLRVKNPRWLLAMILTAVSLALGFVAFFALSPKVTNDAATAITFGIFLWVEAAMDGFCYFYTDKQIREKAEAAAAVKEAN